MNQSDVLEIVGHFVDKKWGIGSALNSSGLQVTLAQFPDTVFAQLGEDFWVFSCRILAFLVTQFA